MKLNEIVGSPYNRGQKFGKVFKQRIKSLVESRNIFWSTKFTEEQISKSFEKNIGIFESFAPEILEELKGLIAGAELNEKFLVSSISSPHFSPTFCSAFVVLHSLNKSKEPIMGRNVDSFGESKENMVYILVNPDKGYKHICSRYLDSVGYYDGMNEMGLAISWAGVFAEESEIAPGLLMFFLTKLSLERCSSVEEAIRLIKRIPISNAANFLILDKKEAAIVETTSKHKFVRKVGTENFLIINNNFSSNEMKKYDAVLKKHPEAADPRIKRYTELLGGGDIDVETCKKILSDHDGGICNHDGENCLGETVSSFIALPKSKSVLYSKGPPCKNTYFNYTI